MFEITAKGRAFIDANRPRGGNAPWVRAEINPRVRRQAQPLPPA
jgi:hypothetical protein